MAMRLAMVAVVQTIAAIQQTTETADSPSSHSAELQPSNWNYTI